MMLRWISLVPPAMLRILPDRNAPAAVHELADGPPGPGFGPAQGGERPYRGHLQRPFGHESLHDPVTDHRVLPRAMSRPKPARSEYELHTFCPSTSQAPSPRARPPGRPGLWS
jgi:hypothetical protein